MTLDLVNTLDITDDTVAIMVEDDPMLIEPEDVREIVDGLARGLSGHPKAAGLMILVGSALKERITPVTEAEMNRLGWFRRRH